MNSPQALELFTLMKFMQQKRKILVESLNLKTYDGDYVKIYKKRQLNKKLDTFQAEKMSALCRVWRNITADCARFYIFLCGGAIFFV